jgi:hypothetical protein
VPAIILAFFLSPSMVEVVVLLTTHVSMMWILFRIIEQLQAQYWKSKPVPEECTSSFSVEKILIGYESRIN